MIKVQGPEDKDVVQEAKDIVDGHRDATLLLLWKILYGCELRHVRSSYRHKVLTVLDCTVCTVLCSTLLSFYCHGSQFLASQAYHPIEVKYSP